MRILVVGAAGRLGSAVVRQFAAWAEVTGTTRETLDVCDRGAVRQRVAAVRPAAIVNCAAYNDVDGAEDAPVEALEVNAFAVRTLAEAARSAGAALVHYSTDFVFDGAATVPYTEAVRPSPRGTYAASKLLGEWFALESPRGFALRVESLFGSPAAWSGRRGTLDGIVAGLEQGREVKVFTDRVVSPGYVVDIAAATRHLVTTGAAPGLYHCVNTGYATWFDVASHVAAILGVANPRLVPITMDQVTLKAPRPRFCALAVDKLSGAGFDMPPWQDALRRWLTTWTVATT
jgi:dTDP-4-dehydrorhamnose reductase